MGETAEAPSGQKPDGRVAVMSDRSSKHTDHMGQIVLERTAEDQAA